MDIHAGTVLVGVDGSTASDQAVAWAVDHAVREHRSLTLVHALGPVIPVWPTPDGPPPYGYQGVLREAGQAVLDAVRATVTQLAPDLVVHEALELTAPRQTLVEASRTAALLVVGSRGWGPLASMLLGSVSVSVARQAHCPVVVHRPTPDLPQRHGVAVGVEASPDAGPVLEMAFHEAELRGVPLTVLHSLVLEEMPWNGPEADGAPLMDVQRLGLSEALAGHREKHPDVEVHRVIEPQLPGYALLDLADRMELLVVGLHHQRRAAQMMFGSAAVWLVEHATCPVAVVPLGRPAHG